jgi:hypothetical protein
VVRQGITVGKLLVATEPRDLQAWLTLSVHDATTFIRNRMERYPAEKWTDRMFFSSELMQHFASQAGRQA